MDYPTPDGYLSQSGSKRTRSDTENDPARETPQKKQKWVFKSFVYSGPQDPESDLCQSCQTIDFEAIFQLQVNMRATIPVFGFEQQSVMKTYSCPMCAYLVGEISTEKNKASRAAKNGWNLRAHPSYVAKEGNRRDQWPYGVMLKLHPGPPVDRDYIPGSKGSLLIPASKANESSSSTIPRMQGQPLSRTIFDFAALRALLKLCIDTHDCTPITAPVLPDSTKFIDCETRKLVSLPSGAEYITLSYVWGKQVQSEKEAREEANLVRDSGCLPTKTPQTIEDAIRAVVISQQRYLWVDRYCIDQYHSTQKQIQISAMADIYEGALFTIIALGDSADSGVHGISRPFNAQLRFKIRGQEYVSSGQSLQDHLKRSTWGQRAWVYQEAVLSRRCLIFTPEQAFLTCLQNTVCQVLPAPAIPRAKRDEGCELRRYFDRTIIRALQHNVQNDDPYDWLEPHLELYNRRSMTRSTDALNAFKGILSRSGVLCWWGIPIHRRDFKHTLSADDELTCRFVCGLLWKIRWDIEKGVEDYSERYEGFPSWTWVSLRAPPIRFPWTPYSTDDYTIFCPELLVVGNDGAEAVSLDKFTGGQTCSSLPESASIISLKTYVTKVDLYNSDRRIGIAYQSAPTVRSRVVYWDDRSIPNHRKGKTWERATALLMRITVSELTYSVSDDEIICDRDYGFLYCKWLIVEEFEGRPARRLGVVETELNRLDKTALTWRSIELG